MVAPNTETAIWERLMEPEEDLSPEAAKFFLRIDFRSSDHERMEELAEKSNEGTLSEPERKELENYIRVGNVLALMQSKARLSLSRRSHGS